MLSPVLASVLASRRSLFNQRVAEARHRWPGFDTAALGAFIAQTLDPLCVAASAADAAATPTVAEVGFDIGLELVAQGLAGPAARLPWVDMAWRQLATPAAALIAQVPLQALGSITNAVVRMGNTPGVRVDEWIERMLPLAARCDSVAALRGVGALCAWQAGMAHLRDTALAQVMTLPADLAAAALGVEAAQWDSSLARLQANRWWNPRTQVVDPQGRALGGFSGLGGAFPSPPQLRANGAGFIACCGERYFLLMADAFGGVVLPASAAEFAAARAAPVPQVSMDAQGARVGQVRIAFQAPAEGLRAVAGPAGIALFSPCTHYVRIVPEAV